MAFAQTERGDADAIFPWLEQTFLEKSGWMLHLKIEPASDPVRGDARTAQLMAQANPLAARRAAASS